MAGLDRGVDGLRIGVVTELSGEGYEPAVEAATTDMVARLEKAGVEVVEVSLPTFDIALSAYYLIAPAECSSNLARFDGVRYGLRVDGATTEEMMARTRAEGFGPEVTRRVLLGTYALSAGYYDAFYGQAQRVRAAIQEDFARAYEQVDVLVSPTSPTVAFEAGARTSDPLAMYLSDICTIPSNLAGHPAISVPVGLDDAGLPIGFQVMAPALGEEIMYRVAAEVERLAGFEIVTASWRGARRELGAGHRDRGPRRADDRLEDVLRLCRRLRRRAQHQRLPHMPWPARRPPGDQSGRDRVDHGHRARLRLRGLGSLGVPPKELLLRRPSEELPDLPVRRPGLSRRASRHRGRRRDPPRRHRARPHGGGHREVALTSVPAVASTPQSRRFSISTGRGCRWSRSCPDRICAAPTESRAYAQELRSIVAELGVSDARMEEGSIRFDANVSIRPEGED